MLEGCTNEPMHGCRTPRWTRDTHRRARAALLREVDQLRATASSATARTSRCASAPNWTTSASAWPASRHGAQVRQRTPAAANCCRCSTAWMPALPPPPRPIALRAGLELTLRQLLRVAERQRPGRGRAGRGRGLRSRTAPGHQPGRRRRACRRARSCRCSRRATCSTIACCGRRWWWLRATTDALEPP